MPSKTTIRIVVTLKRGEISLSAYNPAIARPVVAMSVQKKRHFASTRAAETSCRTEERRSARAASPAARVAH